VIGFAGSEDKLKWLKDDLGFDHVFNYKTANVHKTLREFAPKGVDCYFDNVWIIVIQYYAQFYIKFR